MKKPSGATWPEERSKHAACCLNYGQKFPQMLISGGVGKDLKALRDAWILCVATGTWKEVDHYSYTYKLRRIKLQKHYNYTTLMWACSARSYIHTHIALLSDCCVNSHCRHLYILAVLSQSVHCVLQITLPEDMSPRYGHSLTATSLTPELTDVTMFGGCTKWDPKPSSDIQRPLTADTTKLTIGRRLNTVNHAAASSCSFVTCMIVHSS